jgi:hypothetical protein
LSITVFVTVLFAKGCDMSSAMVFLFWAIAAKTALCRRQSFRRLTVGRREKARTWRRKQRLWIIASSSWWWLSTLFRRGSPSSSLSACSQWGLAQLWARLVQVRNCFPNTNKR